MRHTSVLALLLFACLSTAHADDLDNLDALSQAEFDALAADLAGVLNYKSVQPAEPYGVIGFDVGLEASVVRIDNAALWERAGVDGASSMPMARLSVTKGLPFGFDVGGFAATAPGTGLANYGAQLRYALVEGGVATPAVGLRAAVTRLNGVEQLDYTTRSLDISISKGIGPITPYAGYGRVWADATPYAGSLVEADVRETRMYAGARFTFVVLQFALEAERVGDTDAYSAKLAFGF